MKLSFRYFTGSMLMLALPLMFTSCEGSLDDIFGEWSRPTIVAVSSITLNQTELTKGMGGAVTLTATVAPDNATFKTVTWTTSNPTVATVTDGVVTIVGVGSAIITAKAGDKTATCTVSNPFLPGLFTVDNTGKKVRFSMGNLQATYNGTSWSWAFAENQWDYIGNAEGNTKVSTTSPFVADYTGSSTTVDLFGWVGASSIWTGAAQYGITSAAGITYLDTTNGYGNKNGSEGETLKSDWGTLPITNGGNTANYGWRTLTSAEWVWILGPSVLVDPGTNCRVSGSTANGTSDARFTFATINTDDTPVNGLIIFPDGVTIANGEATSWGNINAQLTSSDWANSTQCTTAQWTALAAKGCVFLPAAGERGGTYASYSGTSGRYWSSSPNGSDKAAAMYLLFLWNAFAPFNSNSRHAGCSVRLVYDAE